MIKKLFQVVYNTDGFVESCQEMPAEPEKKRVLFVREETEAKARKRAEALYSFAK